MGDRREGEKGGRKEGGRGGGRREGRVGGRREGGRGEGRKEGREGRTVQVSLKSCSVCPNT